MAVMTARRASERRSEHLLNDLLVSQGWDLRPLPQGDLLLQHEYRIYPELRETLGTASKTGPGAGVPEALLVDRSSVEPLAVIEAKAAAQESNKRLGRLRTTRGPSWRPGTHPLL